MLILNNKNNFQNKCKQTSLSKTCNIAIIILSIFKQKLSIYRILTSFIWIYKPNLATYIGYITFTYF